MNKFRAKKEQTVAEIKTLLQSSSSLAIAEYRGLTVNELEDLRKELKSSGTFVKVYKNRLFKIAAQELGFEGLADSLVGPNLFAFGSTDAIAPAKIIFKKSKDQPILVLKGGIYENHVVSSAEIQEIATLPNFEEALTMLASSLQGGLKQLAIGLQLLIDENKLQS
ncbi:50S ribosomal protein L10 [Mesomycoplasma conjunctivae]|uniref:Large ribosomal subunit protein uL10 n=1 Tax=Mesomycoplasma conjunctivae (strain ATCC 25834 / NCTC 10147 / HRC/581) TaxID=572263 RepID=C5J7B7_MESCH|nr:50S ribosomal protein L10 [Mesomycoplasma conjunctivae]CAT05380.1 50S ribosomal protein L10 [Mesomycoplasma conjunctivae]VEU66606.1 50S ribosomal protein L10 [Mesomycoplasma conjunctivae]